MATALSRLGVRRSLLSAAVAAAVALLPVSARATMPTFDAANYDANMQDLAKTVQLLQQTQSLVDKAQSMSSVLGSGGASAAGALGFSSGTTSLLSGMSCLFPNMSSWSIPSGITPNFSSVCSGRKFIDSMFTLPNPNDPAQKNLVGTVNRAAILKQRHTVYREASLNGLALAYQQKQAVPQDAQRVASIAAEAAAAPDIHTDLQVTNKLLVEVLNQLLAQRMVMAGLLEAVSSKQLQSVPVNFYGDETALKDPGTTSTGAFGE